jgi:hypothetical protein
VLQNNVRQFIPTVGASDWAAHLEEQPEFRVRVHLLLQALLRQRVVPDIDGVRESKLRRSREEDVACKPVLISWPISKKQ